MLNHWKWGEMIEQKSNYENWDQMLDKGVILLQIQSNYSKLRQIGKNEFKLLKIKLNCWLDVQLMKM